jgi:hypothetical protein
MGCLLYKNTTDTTGWGKKYDSLIYYDLKSKRYITLKQVTVYPTMFNLNFDICLVPFHAIWAEITVMRFFSLGLFET